MPIPHEQSIAETDFIALDTETTGLSWRYCQLVEVAAIRFRIDGTPHATYQQLIDPGCAIPYAASAVHGITDHMVRGKPQVHHVLPELLNFLTHRDGILLIHNASFDLGFLRAAATQCGLLCPDILVLDTLGLCRKLLKDMHSHKLDLLAARYCGRSRADHRAAGDASVLITVFQRLLEAAGHPATVGDLLAYAKPKSLSYTQPAPTRKPRRVYMADPSTVRNID